MEIIEWHFWTHERTLFWSPIQGHYYGLTSYGFALQLCLRSIFDFRIGYGPLKGEQISRADIVSPPLPLPNYTCNVCRHQELNISADKPISSKKLFQGNGYVRWENDRKSIFLIDFVKHVSNKHILITRIETKSYVSICTTGAWFVVNGCNKLLM